MATPHPAFNEVLALVERGPFFEASGEPPPHQAVHDREEALACLLDEGQAREDARLAIVDAAVAAGARDKMIELDETIGDTLEPHVRRRLTSGYEDALDDVLGDLTWWVLGRVFTTPTLLEAAWEAYRAGYLPCGYRGAYPSGTLLVHRPRATAPGAPENIG